MAQKMTYWLLVTLIFSLGFGQLLRFSLWGIPLYFHDVLVVCLLALQFGSLKTLKMPQSIKIFLIGLSIGWVNALFHYPLTQLGIPFLYTIRLVAYLELYFSLKQSKIILPNFYFLISGFISLVIGYLQYFLLPDMRIFQYLGWDDHLYRLTLPHFDPTFTAVMLSLSVLYIYKTQYARLAIVYLPAIFLTYSRSVWLSLFAVGLIYAVQSKKYFKLLLAAVLLILVILIQPKKFGEGRNLLRVFSIESRVNHDLSYIGKYKWNLFAGRGMNTLVLDSSDSNTPNHATSPNNSYLYLLLTSGILGLAGWGMFMFDLFKKSTYKFMLIMFFVASLFNNVMFYPFALLSVFLVECQSNK